MTLARAACHTVYRLPAATGLFVGSTDKYEKVTGTLSEGGSARLYPAVWPVAGLPVLFLTGESKYFQLASAFSVNTGHTFGRAKVRIKFKTAAHIYLENTCNVYLYRNVSSVYKDENKNQPMTDLLESWKVCFFFLFLSFFLFFHLTT